MGSDEEKGRRAVDDDLATSRDLPADPSDLTEITRLTPEKIATHKTQRLTDEPSLDEGEAQADPDATIKTPLAGKRRRTAAAPTADLEVGSRIANRYLILGELGKGGMGVVYRARDEMLDLEVAVKVLRPDVASDRDFLQRFRQELLVARQVTHRHVARIHDISEDQGLFFITMDFVRGRSLQDRLAEEGALSVEETTRLGAQIADALAEAHRQGVVHRDLKPANILLDEKGDSYITDFGIARSLSHSGLTQTGEVLGTPAYLSPEQARGERVDARSDLYTLGIMMTQMLSGKLPFAKGSVLEMIAQRMTGKLHTFAELGIEVPSALATIVGRCLAKSPDNRYGSAEELAADLRDWKRAERRERWRRMGKGLAMTGLLVLAVAIVYFAIEAIRTRSETSPAPVAQSARAIEAKNAVFVLPPGISESATELDWIPIALADLLTQNLYEQTDLRTIDLARVLERTDDLGLDADQLELYEIEKVAESLGADRAIRGRIDHRGGQPSLEIEVIELDRQDQPSRALAPIALDPARLTSQARDLADAVFEVLDVKVERSLLAQPISAEAAALYSEGLGLFAEGDAASGTQALEQSTEVDATFGQAWLRLSEAYSELGRHDESLSAAQEALSRTPTGTRSHKLAEARIAMISGAPETAVVLLRDHLETYATDIEARMELAEAHGDVGAFPAALKELEVATELDPTNAELWFLRGRFSIQSGAMREAVDDYLVKALVLYTSQRNRPGQALIHNALGVGWQRLGMADEARESYEKAAAIRRELGLMPGLADSLHNLAMIDLERGELEAVQASLDEAMSIYEEARNPEGIGFIANALGLLEEEKGDYRLALDHYKRSLQVRNELGDESAVVESYNNVGYCYYLLGEYDNALLYLERSLELARDNGDLWAVMLALQSSGSCRLDQGLWPEAQLRFEEALSLGRELDDPFAQAVSQLNLGRISFYQGDLSTALEAFAEAGERLAEMGDPRGETEASLGSIEALLELGDLASSRERLDAVLIRLDEGGNQEQKALALTLSGRWEIESGDPDAGRAILEQALAEARASGSAAAEIRAEIFIGSSTLLGGNAPRALRELVEASERAESLGHAVLRLRTAEALAQAHLDSGDPRSAEEILRRALRLAGQGGFWARTTHLHELLGTALEAQSSHAAAEAERRRAEEERSRILDLLDEEHRPIYGELRESGSGS